MYGKTVTRKQGLPSGKGNNSKPEETEATEAGATIQDVLAAISTLSDNVDRRFTELGTTFNNLKTEVSSIDARVVTTEEATISHEKRIEELEGQYAILAAQCKEHQDKLSSMEERARRQNIRIVGIEEKAESGKLSDFVSNLLPTLLGEEHFNMPIRIDYAFRNSNSNSTSRTDRKRTKPKPRPITVRFHHLSVKELVIKLARESSGLQYADKPVFIYPDLSPDIIQRRQKFADIKQKCKTKKIRYGFRHPAKFIVTAGNTTEIFESPVDANAFLGEMVDGWSQDTPAAAAEEETE